MSEGTSQNTVPQFIEPRKFCGQGVLLSGDVSSKNLLRLAAASVASQSIKAELEFGVDQERRRTVSGKVSAELLVECQRCLEPMPFRVDADFHWAVVWDEERAKQLPSYLEPWIASEEPEDLYAMIEEELLLALPTAPMHSELCIESSLLTSGEEPVKSDKELKNNPFQALAALKGEASKD